MDNYANKSWCFTINNYTEKCIEHVKAIPAKRIIAGFEVGEKNGTPHIQGAIIFSKTHRMKAVCAALGGRASLRKMKGEWSDQDYCFKEGNLLRMEDNSKKPGTRTDLEEFRDAIKNDANDIELFDKHLEVLAKYPHLERRLRRCFKPPEAKSFRNVTVIVHWGHAGKGKTRTGFESEDDVFLIPKTKDFKWWNGYYGQKTVLLDDFYGNMPWSHFLTLLDGYPMQVETKGGMEWCRFTKIYITSNVHPSKWYRMGRVSEDGDELVPELQRRISEIIHFKKDL